MVPTNLGEDIAVTYRVPDSPFFLVGTFLLVAQDRWSDALVCAELHLGRCYVCNQQPGY